MSVPDNISLPEIQGDAEVLVMGTSHLNRTLVPLLASQFRALGVETLYIETEQDLPIYADLQGSTPVPADRLANETCFVDGFVDIIMAAQAAGIRVVGIDDRQRELIELKRAHASSSDEGVDAEFLAASNDLNRHRTTIMAEAILRDRAALRELGDRPGRSVVLAGGNHVDDLPLTDGTKVPGIGAQLRHAGVAATDVIAIGEVESLSEVIPALDQAIDEWGADRNEAFTIGMPDPHRTFLYLPERPVTLSSRRMVFDRLFYSPDEVEQAVLSELPRDDPNASYLLGYAAARAAGMGRAAAHFADGAANGEPVQYLDQARALLIGRHGAGSEARSADREQRALAALHAAVDAGVSGAARIAAGHLHGLGRSIEAMEMSRRADRAELDRVDLWPADRLEQRTRLQSQVERSSSVRSPGATARRRAQRPEAVEPHQADGRPAAGGTPELPSPSGSASKPPVARRKDPGPSFGVH